MKKQAILVIDLQNEYLPTGKLPLAGIEKAVENAAKVMADARKKTIPVIHIQHVFTDGERAVFEPDSDGIEIQPVVAPAKDEMVIVKNEVNAFLNTRLQQVLQDQSVEELIVMGAMTHMCVDAAVRAASDLGYKVTVIHDACSTLDLAFNGLKVPAAYAHATLMAAFEFAYAKVISTADYLAKDNHPMRN